jgi:general secretion pathway protein H
MDRTGGFTVIELLLVVALAATVGGLGTVTLPHLAGSVRLASAADRLAAVLRAARGQALARGRSIEVRFDPAARTWSVRERLEPPFEVHQLPTGVVYQSLPSALRVRFSTVGTADNATVVLAAGGRARRIVVNQRGRVHLP